MHSAALEYASQALYLVLIISLPPIVIASVIGILLSLIQAVTQLQEQTLTFGVKLIAVVVSLFLLGGWMVDDVFEPLMAAATDLPVRLFGAGKGSGAAAFFLVLGFAGVAVCLWYWVKLRKYTWAENNQ